MKIKEKIKKNKAILKLVRYIKLIRKYIDDANFFIDTYSFSSEAEEKLLYRMSYIVHSIEKALTNEKLRPFGKDKVTELLNLVIDYEKLGYDRNRFAFKLAISALEKYVNIYNENQWKEEEIHTEIKKVIENYKDTPKIDIGSYKIDLSVLEEGKNFDYFKFIKSRHSVRNFSKNKINRKDLEKAIEMAMLTPSACNRQMIKAYYIENFEIKDNITELAMGISCFDKKNVNYLIITFDNAAFQFDGERNQGWFNAGLFTMNLMNAFHSLGIGSCCIEFANEKKDELFLKKLINIGDSEKIAIILAVGYYSDNTVIPYSSRKKIEEILEIK
ncbi:putative uncharacterized protein [Clostridium sp. CAG:575]|nr:putative uncharacterized protein [Clostridium sp. CAG:575]